MQKKILITVSDETSHLYGVRFAGSFFRNKPAVGATLFYVAPRLALGDTGPVGSHLKTDRATQKRVKTALDAAGQKLLDRGFLAGNVDTSFTANQFGTVKDIIRKARSGKYDAVVLGRRGYMFFESVVSSSVTRQILAKDVDFPIWICKNPREDSRNVLVCVDGSDAALRMVDHVGFILAEESEHTVTLFHVDTGETRDREALMEEARVKLIENGVSRDRIDCTVVRSGTTGVAKKVLEKASVGNFAAIGVGRVGIRTGGLTEWLVGSRTMKIVESLENGSLWISS
ncbi:MAG: universal stress protein [Syntrophobacteraceae bacterium]|nr:universal stress protein [Syntrophobacteraceae bacterium]